MRRRLQGRLHLLRKDRACELLGEGGGRFSQLLPSFRCRHCSFYKDERGQGFGRYIPRPGEGLFALALNARIELAKANIGLDCNHSLIHDYAYAAGYQNPAEPVPALLSDPYLTDAFLYGQDQRRADDAEDTADRFHEMMTRLTATA